MSTSHARFRRWTQTAALLAVLCAASVLLLGGRDTSAWDTTDATIPHKEAHHGVDGDGWLNKKHDIESKVEGPLATRGCRSLLDPTIVNNKTRGPTSVPTSSTTTVPVTIVVELGVNFRARNCIDFYECDDGNGKYLRSEWKEDHHHGRATGSTIVHQSTYTIKLNNEAMLDGEGQVRKFNFDDTAVNAELTAACGGTTPTTTTPGTPPERCPAGSTFEGRPVGELTDGQSCSVTAVPPPTTVPPTPTTPTTTPTTQTPSCPS